MDHDDLHRIADALAAGDCVEGWSAHNHAHDTVLTQLPTGRVFLRKGLTGPWDELKPSGAGDS